MTRTETIKVMMQKMAAITGTNSKNYTREAMDEIWDMCSDWNRDHYEGHGDEAEIFMYEDWDEDDNYIVYIEDERFSYFE